MTAPSPPPDQIRPAGPTPVAEPTGRPAAEHRLPPADAALILQRLQAAVGQRVIGSREVVRALTIAVAVEGHVLIEGVPGIAKTFLARTFAQSLGLTFQRIQFTPDMLPSDIIGGLVMDPTDRSFVYRPGPLFAHVVLADEINRAPPKVQSALLEAMQEQQVTVDRRTYPLPRPFLVIATQNPVEQEGTYPLPEAELDRFLFRWVMTYPSADDEAQVVRSQIDPREAAPAPAIVTPDEVDRLRGAVGAVRVDESVVRYVTALVAATRADTHLEIGASPRGAVQFMRAACAAAYLAGRSYALPDDVQEMQFPTLNHRVVVQPEFRGRRSLPGDHRGSLEVVRTILADELRTVPVPR